MSDRDIKQQTNNKLLGRYKVLQRLGRGGMGDVWLCEDPRLHRQVAIKTLPAHNQQDEEFVARFEHEAQAAAALNHPHILPIHDYGSQSLADGSLVSYIVMPYIRGGSLANRMASYAEKQALMLIPQALTFLSQAAEAIDHAHEQNVIHRDIKPGNMLLREDDWLLLADFGIARMLTAGDRLTTTGPGFGTPEYMAPEQAQGQAVISSDNYSLAVIAYQLFTGRLPFQADTGYAITIQHLTMPPPPPREINPALSAAFEQVLLQGLAKQPEERPASATAFVEALQHAHAVASSEVTYRKATISQTANTVIKPDSDQHVAPQDTILADNKSQDHAQSLLTRRRLLLGGSTATILALGGGLEAWKLLSTSTSRRVAPQITKTIKNPNAPTFVLTGHNFPANTLAWHPQKNILVSASGQDYRMFTWDIDALLKQPNISPLYATRTDLSAGSSMPLEAWSPDGTYLAIVNNWTTGTSKNTSIDLYTLDMKSLVLKKSANIIVPTQNSLYGMGWLDKRYIVTMEPDLNTISHYQFFLRILDITQPQTNWKPATIQGNLSGPPGVLAISPNSSAIAINAVDRILVGQADRVNNAVKWQPILPPLQVQSGSTTDALTGVAWSADGNKIITVDVSSTGTTTDAPTTLIPTFWNWHAKTPKLQVSGIPDQSNSPSLLALVSNPASMTPCFAMGNRNSIVSLWNAVGGTSPTRTLDTNGINAPVATMAWSQDGHWLATSFEDVNASILIWKV